MKRPEAAISIDIISNGHNIPIMLNPTGKALSAAIIGALRPLAKILLRNGIAYGTFAQLAKKVYVDVAFGELQDQGNKQTVSRVSALTGLPRKAVKVLRDLPLHGEEQTHDRYNRAIRVINGWVNDARFLNEEGWPAELLTDGGEASFAALVKDYGRDVPPATMLSVLVSAGSVEEVEGRVRLIRRAFVPSGDSVDKIRFLGTEVAELIATIDHNITSAPGELYFQRKVSNDLVKPAVLPEFRKLSASRAQALLEDLNQWLSTREMDSPSAAPNTERKYVSLGIYYHERDYSEDETR